MYNYFFFSCLNLPPQVGRLTWYSDWEVESPERLSLVQRGQVVVGSEHVVVDDHVGQKVVTCIGEPRGSTVMDQVVPPTIIDRTSEDVIF